MKFHTAHVNNCHDELGTYKLYNIMYVEIHHIHISVLNVFQKRQNYVHASTKTLGWVVIRVKSSADE
jgi:hypothetical protein